MSRFTFLNDKKEPNKIFKVAYGYDRPLQEYFIQVFDINAPDTDEDDIHCIVWEGNNWSGKSNSEMQELFETWGVPENHINQVSLDLPF